MVNDTTRIAILILCELYRARDLVPTSYFTNEFDIPNGNVRAVVRSLGSARFIRSFPGINGGLELAIDLEDLSVLDVHKVMQGRLECKFRFDWPELELVYQEACKAFNDVLDKQTLSQLLERGEHRLCQERTKHSKSRN